MTGLSRNSASSGVPWPKGVGAPAIRALVAAGYTELRQLAGVPASTLARLHGMGPKALSRLREALEAQGMSLGED
jgi:hypothetical protein